MVQEGQHLNSINPRRTNWEKGGKEIKEIKLKKIAQNLRTGTFRLKGTIKYPVQHMQIAQWHQGASSWNFRRLESQRGFQLFFMFGHSLHFLQEIHVSHLLWRTCKTLLFTYFIVFSFNSLKRLLRMHFFFLKTTYWIPVGSNVLKPNTVLISLKATQCLTQGPTPIKGTISVYKCLLNEAVFS